MGYPFECRKVLCARDLPPPESDTTKRRLIVWETTSRTTAPTTATNTLSRLSPVIPGTGRQCQERCPARFLLTSC